MITLHQFRSAWGLPSASPFCMKVETYLRMAELPFSTKVADSRKAPKQKLPYIEDEGVLVCDSTAILEHLKKTRGDRLDHGLDANQLARAHVIRRMVEEGLYWTMVYSRWVDDPGWALTSEALLRPVLPPVVRAFLPGIIRKSVAKQVHAQGTGRHTRSEIYEIGQNDLAALSTLLGEGPYFLGQSPTSIDATTYAFFAIILWAPPGSPLTEKLKSLPNLAAYCERMRARFYGESGG